MTRPFHPLPPDLVWVSLANTGGKRKKLLTEDAEWTLWKDSGFWLESPDPMPIPIWAAGYGHHLGIGWQEEVSGTQILPPLVPPASSAALLGSTPAGPGRSTLAVVPVHLLVVLTTDDPCGQHSL